MQKINVFVKKGYYFNLTDVRTGEINMFNPPMYNTTIELYKGIDNTIQFSIRDNDRKAFCLRDKKLFLTIINPKLHTKLVKELWCLDAYKGLYEVKILESELRDFESTYYQASVIYKDLEGEETMLYSSINYDPVFSLHINDGFRDVYKPSISLNPEEFLHNFYIDRQDGQRYDYYISSMLKADETDSHTASITVQDYFLGTITMEGSMDDTPQENSDYDWFVIDTKEYTDETKVKEETFQFNKQLNCKWVRFKYTIKSANFQGKITEILYRN